MSLELICLIDAFVSLSTPLRVNPLLTPHLPSNACVRICSFIYHPIEWFWNLAELASTRTTLISPKAVDHSNFLLSILDICVKMSSLQNTTLNSLVAQYDILTSKLQDGN